MLGAVIGIASLLGIFGGLAILMFVGFGGTERYVSEWHVIKWTALGAAMFLVGVTITHHPFEVAKGIIVVQEHFAQFRLLGLGPPGLAPRLIE